MIGIEYELVDGVRTGRWRPRQFRAVGLKRLVPSQMTAWPWRDPK